MFLAAVRNKGCFPSQLQKKTMSQDTVNSYHQAVTKAAVKTFQHSRTSVVYIRD